MLFRWPDWFPSNDRAAVHVALLRAKRILGESELPFGLSRQQLERYILDGGLECVITFLKQVQKLVRQVDIPFDEIDAAARVLRYDAIREIWREKGFDQSGQRLPVPVAGRALSAAVLAIIAGLPGQQQVDRLLEEIAAFLAFRISVEVVIRHFPAMALQLGEVTVETTVQSATKRGRPKKKPETDEYRRVKQLLHELNGDDQIRRHGYRVSKEDLINIVESNPAQFHRYENHDPKLSKTESQRIQDILRKPKPVLVEKLLQRKGRCYSDHSLK
jgi:hypothetical protein